MTNLPIEAVLPRLQAALGQSPLVVLQAPPGAGKTTRVPLALLEQPWLEGQRIIMLEPRRLAARNAAIYMAGELGEAVGETVGYRVRFDSRVGPKTRIEVVTEGILTRMLQQDPELGGVGLVIFDEFHERNLHGDLALALCRDAQQGLCESLRLLLMSATLDGEALAERLQAPLVRSEGRSYPVEVHYLPAEPQGRLEDVMVQGIVRALAEQQGDILAFLPGAGEIRRVASTLTEYEACAHTDIRPLYGNLPFAEQEQAILPSPAGRRKVVLATNIAETSLTIEGVTTVIDSGWQRIARFDPRSSLTRLDKVRVSRAAAEQRAGRAGRLGPGVCYRLWSEATQRGLLSHNVAEILEADLAPLTLELAAWGVTDSRDLPWLDEPPLAAFRQAQELLQRLEAIDGQGRITAQGRAMVSLPLHPRLAHMLRRAEAMGLGGLACDVAALLSEREVLRGPQGEADCDFALRVEALHAYRAGGAAAARGLGADVAACRAVERAALQWRRLLGLTGKGRDDGESDERDIGPLLAMAYPDRIAARRVSASDEGRPQPSGRRYLLASGRGAALVRECRLDTPFLVAASLDAGSGEGRIYSAAPIEKEQLEALFIPQLSWQDEVAWDSRSECVVARRQRTLGALVLEQAPLTEVDSGARLAAMLGGVGLMGLEALPWDESARQLQARVLSLRHWLPGDGWPDLSDSALQENLGEWLAPWLDGVTRREQLKGLKLVDILTATLSWEQQQRLNELAPTHISVPSGSRKKLLYHPDGAPPVLAVKLQELFGLEQTPMLANGRIKVMLHLLSPAQRPIQVTQDLQSFWHNTYPEVKKELKGRYPKHPWPDDPWHAEATARTKRR